MNNHPSGTEPAPPEKHDGQSLTEHNAAALPPTPTGQPLSEQDPTPRPPIAQEQAPLQDHEDQNVQGRKGARTAPQNAEEVSVRLVLAEDTLFGKIGKKEILIGILTPIVVAVIGAFATILVPLIPQLTALPTPTPTLAPVANSVPAMTLFEVRVVDFETRQPITDGKVSLSDELATLVRTTDSFGVVVFRTDSLNPSHLVLWVETAGYQTHSENLVSPATLAQPHEIFLHRLTPTPTVTSLPSATPTATPTVLPTKTEPPTPSATLTKPASRPAGSGAATLVPGAVYVKSIAIVPARPRSKEPFKFQVTFLNTSGANFTGEWNVAIYRPGEPDNKGKPQGLGEIHLNLDTGSTAETNQTVIGGCQDFYAIAVIRFDPFRQIRDTPFPDAPGGKNRLDFQICH